jgi:hypothetical protein
MELNFEKIRRLLPMAEAARRMGEPLPKFYQAIFKGELLPDFLLIRGGGHSPLLFADELESTCQKLFGHDLPKNQDIEIQ